MMKRFHLLVSIVAASGIWLSGFWCGSGWAEHSKNWIHESEFLGESSLHARPHHTVVLHPKKGSRTVKHSIPYFFEERAKYNICIDEEDPLLDSMKLVNAEGEIVALVNRKHRCVKRTIPKGHYTMHVYHNGEAAGGGLPHAFIHSPKAPLPLGENNPLAADYSVGDPALGDPRPSGRYWTIEAANRKPLRLNGGRLSPSDDLNSPIMKFNFGGLNGDTFG